MHFCWEASYMGAKKISHKAKCSMAPRNCQYEISQVIVLANGMKKTIYYCMFFPETGQSVEAHSIQPTKIETQLKNSCRLDGT